jgi:hypothetical protein
MYDVVILVPSAVVLLTVVAIASQHPDMFLKRHGRLHAISGALYLTLLIIGFVGAAEGTLGVFQPLAALHIHIHWLCFDVCLGVLGTFLAASAAYEHGRKRVVNTASGTLDAHATVTRGEMIEHAYYQALNTMQVRKRKQGG